MNRIRGRAAGVAAGACLVAVLIVVPSAQAAVTSSHIATPKNNVYFVYNKDTPNTFSVSGTTNGTAGDNVDINCYAGDKVTTVASDVTVNSNGSFSAPAASDEAANTYRVCQLRAIPHGTTPDPLTPFAGPHLYVGQKETFAVSGGANNGKAYDFYYYFQQPNGGMDYDSLGGCGIDDGYLLDSHDSLTAVTWYCNAWLHRYDVDANPTRSQIQVDGGNAYTPTDAEGINSAATSGLPTVTHTYSQNAKTGNAVIHDTETFVKCANTTYPPTNSTCPSFTSAGVSDSRTIVQNDGGKVAWITDVFKSTNKKAHTVDLLWQNDQHFYESGGNTNQIEYAFPGHSAYSTHALGDTVKLPNKPGTIFVRYHGAADGDTAHGRGAIVYSHAATLAKFMYLSNSQSDFTLHQSIKVPAHGSVTLRWAYIADFHQATVNSLAKHATVVVKGCTVPNVVGKTLAAAKKAIKRANCAVGKVRHVHPTKASSGRVVSQSPKAKTNVDYGTKVALKVGA
jgi:hypothetical protein